MMNETPPDTAAHVLQARKFLAQARVYLYDLDLHHASEKTRAAYSHTIDAVALADGFQPDDYKRSSDDYKRLFPNADGHQPDLDVETIRLMLPTLSHLLDQLDPLPQTSAADRPNPLVPPYDFSKCPTCKPELEVYTAAVLKRNPRGLTLSAANAITLAYYHEGILHQKGHPVTIVQNGLRLKRDPARVNSLNQCGTCQDERVKATLRVDLHFPGYVENPERVPLEAIEMLSIGMYHIGVLHDLEHPVSLTDYVETTKTDDL